MLYVETSICAVLMLNCLPLLMKHRWEYTEYARVQNVYSCYYPTDQSLEWPTVQRNDSRTIDLASYFLAAQYAAWKSRQSEVEAWAWKRGERDWFAETKWSTVFLRTLPDMTLVQARRQSCRTPFSLPLFCPFAKTQVFFFFLQTTHSLLYSCLPWFLTELPTLPTGPSNSCIRFFFLIFFCFVAQSFAILNANKRARLWGRISRDHAYHRRWEWEETGGKKEQNMAVISQTRWRGRAPWVVVCPGQTEPTSWGFGTWN